MLLVVALLAVLSAWSGVAWSEYLADREAAQQRLARQQLRAARQPRYYRHQRPQQWRAPGATVTPPSVSN